MEQLVHRQIWLEFISRDLNELAPPSGSPNSVALPTANSAVDKATESGRSAKQGSAGLFNANNKLWIWLLHNACQTSCQSQHKEANSRTAL